MKKRIVGCLIAAALVAAGAAAQQDFWTDLVYPDPPNGVPRTYCIGLSERGDAVGWRVIPGTPARAFQLSDGVFYDLHPPGAKGGTLIELQYPGSQTTLPYGINERGTIVGVYRDAQGASHGFSEPPRATS